MSWAGGEGGGAALRLGCLAGVAHAGVRCGRAGSGQPGVAPSSRTASAHCTDDLLPAAAAASLLPVFCISSLNFLGRPPSPHVQHQVASNSAPPTATVSPAANGAPAATTSPPSAASVSQPAATS